MALRPEFRAFVVGLFGDFGRVTLRPMFGIAGIYAKNVIFGLIDGERVYLKTDARSRKAFVREGRTPFEYTKTKEPIVTSYFELPERLYDDSEELAEWARRAHEVALRSQTTQKKRRVRETKPARQPAKRRKRS